MSIRFRRVTRNPAIYWRRRAGFPTPEEEIRNIGLRIQRDFNISLKNCFTPDQVREKLNETIKHFRKAKNVTLDPRTRKRLRSKINHTKVLRDSLFPERIIQYALKHPRSMIMESLFYGYKKAKEMRLKAIKPIAWIRGKVRRVRGSESRKKRFERFHGRRG